VIPEVHPFLTLTVDGHGSISSRGQHTFGSPEFLTRAIYLEFVEGSVRLLLDRMTHRRRNIFMTVSDFVSGFDRDVFLIRINHPAVRERLAS
jgi:hypothetical protein